MDDDRVSAGRGASWYAGMVAAGAGFLSLLSVVWLALHEMEEAAPVGDTGARLMVRALAGTLLMILGTVLMHIGHREDADDAPDELAADRERRDAS